MIQLDTSIDPAVDFYSYVNNIWKKENPIPDEYSRWGNFEILNVKNEERLVELVNDHYLYKQGMNEEELNKYHPTDVLKKHFYKIDNSSYEDCIIYMLQNGIPSIFSLSVYTDLKDSNKNIIYLGPTNLGLPDRDYYFMENKEYIRVAYKEYINKVNTLFNINFEYEDEHKIAELIYTKVEKRDPYKIYNLVEFENLDIGINLEYIFDTLGLPKTKVVVTNPDYFNYIKNFKFSKSYFKWKITQEAMTYLDDTTYALTFDFYGKIIRGLKQMKPRWKRVLNVMKGQFGEYIGRRYVDLFFDVESKIIVENMIDKIKLVMVDSIKNNDWMSVNTKILALEKLEMIKVKIGYPDKWDIFIGEDIEGSWFDNILICNEYHVKKNYDKIYKPVDKDEWHMDAYDINAYYSPTSNEIVFPAGILQEPFFSKEYPMDVNYGGIGTIIAHELTHGFDDKGKLYDKYGNLNDWWDDDSVYKTKIDKLIEQFNKYSLYGEYVNGALTVGENIADLGGVSLSFKASNKTPDFFYAFACIWRENVREEEQKTRLVTDCHSPGIFRVNGSLENISAFHEWLGNKKNDILMIW